MPGCKRKSEDINYTSEFDNTSSYAAFRIKKVQQQRIVSEAHTRTVNLLMAASQNCSSHASITENSDDIPSASFADNIQSPFQPPYW